MTGKVKNSKVEANTLRPLKVLKDQARSIGCSLTTIGDFERLAGINTHSESERKALWDKFRHLYFGPTQVLFDAVMDHCATVALQRIKAGELTLIPTRW